MQNGFGDAERRLDDVDPLEPALGVVGRELLQQRRGQSLALELEPQIEVLAVPVLEARLVVDVEIAPGLALLVGHHHQRVRVLLHRDGAARDAHFPRHYRALALEHRDAVQGHGDALDARLVLLHRLDVVPARFVRVLLLNARMELNDARLELFVLGMCSKLESSSSTRLHSRARGL